MDGDKEMKKKLFNLKVVTFVNKSNQQISITIPRKKIKTYLKQEGGTIPKTVKISLWSSK